MPTNTTFDDGVVYAGPELLHTRKPELYAAVISTYLLATIAVILRFSARRLARAKLWLDDWLCLAAFVFISTQFGLMIYGIWRGLGVHIISLLPDNTIGDAVIFFRILLAEETLYNLSLIFVKLTILALYWRLFHPARYMRIFVYIGTPAVIAWTIGFFVAILTQCIPTSEFWDVDIRLLHRAEGSPRCGVNEYALYLGGAIVHMIGDVALVAAPVPAIWNIARPTAQKVALVAMFLLGGVVCVISGVRLARIVEMDFMSWDVTWSYIDAAMWTVVETNVALVCSCLPSLRPIALLFSESFRTAVDRCSPTPSPKMPPPDFSIEPKTWEEPPASDGGSGSSSHNRRSPAFAVATVPKELV